MRRSNKKLLKILLMFSLSTLALFLGFFTNYWQVAEENWFLEQNYDMESYIYGRLAKSNQNGIFSSGGLTGLGNSDSPDNHFSKNLFEFQRAAYINGLIFSSYSPYYSQIGGQAMLFCLLDQIIPTAKIVKIRTFQIITSLLTASSISIIVLWFCYEFGYLIGLSVLFSSLLSPWLVVFGGKLWWSLWSFYLPMIIFMFYLKYINKSALRLAKIGTLIVIVVFIKCFFTGYEYISTTLVMMMVPFVYYSIKRRYQLKKLVSVFLISIVGSCFAILLSIIILGFQLNAVNEKPLYIVEHIFSTLDKRTFGDSDAFSSIYSESLESRTGNVVMMYLASSFLGSPGNFFLNNPYLTSLTKYISYLFLTILFGVTSILLLAFKNILLDNTRRQSVYALISATWFSLIAPLSWYVIFKSHSYIHIHMNCIIWQMPFTFYGFAICGFMLQPIINIVKNRRIL